MEPNFNQGNPQLAMNFPNWNLDTAVDLNELGDVDYGVTQDPDQYIKKC